MTEAEISFSNTLPHIQLALIFNFLNALLGGQENEKVNLISVYSLSVKVQSTRRWLSRRFVSPEFRP